MSASASEGVVVSENPATGEALAGVRLDDASSYERTVGRSAEAFTRWRSVDFGFLNERRSSPPPPR